MGVVAERHTQVSLDISGARVLCELSTIPHRLAEIADDVSMTRGQVRAEIAAAKRDGWPIKGNPISGYVMRFDPGDETHSEMTEHLSAWGGELYL